MYDCFGFLKLLVFLSFIFICYLAVEYKKHHSSAYVILSIGILGIKLLYVLIYYLMVHDNGLSLSPDEVRYYHEIQQISRNPFLWNPVLGRGPDYQVTPKMGMSYLYGFIFFIFQTESYASVVLLNILFSYLTCVMIYKLTFLITNSKMASIASMFITAVYPEILFWNARILRENVTLFLVPALIYFSILMLEFYRTRYLIAVFLLSFCLLITRAQLVMFLPLTLLYYVIVNEEFGFKRILVWLISVVGFFVLLPFVTTQIRRAAGSTFLMYLNFDYRFWISQLFIALGNLTDVLSLRTKAGFGAVDVLMLPFTIGALFVVVYSFIHRKDLYSTNKQMGLLLFLYVVFVVLLAMSAATNIRFRSAGAPLLMPILGTTIVHFFSRFSFCSTKCKAVPPTDIA